MSGDPERPEAADAGGVAAVERAFVILSAFDERATALTLAELAVRTGYYKSTILRLLVSLERAGFVERGADSLYRIGPSAWRVGSLFLSDIRLGDRLLPIMTSLSAATQESVSFYVPVLVNGKLERMCMLRVDAPRSVRDHVRVGDRLPLGKGAGGRVIRAFSEPRLREDAVIRKARSHASHGERDPEIGGVASPVMGADGRLVGSLTLSAPTSRRDRLWLESMRPLVLNAADEAGRLLGARVIAA